MERLAAVPNVSRAYVLGGQPRVVHIQLDAERLRGYQMTALVVTSAVRGANVTIPAGHFTRDDSVLSGEWHERSTYGEDDWLVSGVATAHGRVYVQHALTGAVGYLDDDTHTEWGGILRREWTYPQVYGAARTLQHANLELVLKTGEAPIGTTPYVHLEISNDGGSTWNELPRREIGLVGEYAQRVRWARLGSAIDRVYRMSVADAVPLQVLGTQIEVS